MLTADRSGDIAPSGVCECPQRGSKGEILAPTTDGPPCPWKRTQVGHRWRSVRCHPDFARQSVPAAESEDSV